MQSRGLLCYVCGTKLPIDVFEDHLKQCERRYKEDTELLPPELRRSIHFASRVAPNKLAPLTDIKEYNRVSVEMHERILPTCPKCGTMFSHVRRLLVHYPQCGIAKPKPKAISVHRFDDNDNSDSGSDENNQISLARGVFGGGSGSGNINMNMNMELFSPNSGSGKARARIMTPKSKGSMSGSGSGSLPRVKSAGTRMKVVCYLCGREYGLASLISHQKKCMIKAKSKDLVPTKPTLAMPRSTDPVEVFERYNAEATKCVKSAIPSCTYCGRKFSDMERLGVHLRGCDLAKEAREKEELENAVFLRGDAVPRFLTCFLCGGQFGSQSLFIHQSLCEKRCEEAQQRLPPSDRADLPEPPACPVPAADDPLSSYTHYNELAAAVYAASLGRCAFCDRSFPIQRLADHEATCTKGKDVNLNLGRSQGEDYDEQNHNQNRPQSVNSWWSPAGTAPRTPTTHVNTPHTPLRSKTSSDMLETCPQCGMSIIVGQLLSHLGVCEGNDQFPSDPEYFEKNLVPCPHCGRTFVENRLAVHIGICSKNAANSGNQRRVRKTWDRTPQTPKTPKTPSATATASTPLSNVWFPDAASSSPSASSHMHFQSPLLAKPQTHAQRFMANVGLRDSVQSLPAEDVEEDLEIIGEGEESQNFGASIMSIPAEEVEENIEGFDDGDDDIKAKPPTATPGRKQWGRAEVPKSFLRSIQIPIQESESSSEGWKFCVNCGAEFISAAKFCHACGEKREH